MDLPFVLTTLTRRGLLTPGSPGRTIAQLAALRRWGFTLAGEARQAAARDPDRVALIDDADRQLTYRELLARAERLATALRATLGVTAGDRIGLLCRNHPDLVVAMVAAGLLGADTVLLHTGLAGPQLAAVADEQRLRVLLHDREFGEQALAVGPDVARVDESRLAALLSTAPDDARIGPPDRDGRTIVLTSGTTGTPKGARRRTPASFGPLAAIIDRIPLRARDRIMIAAPVFHTWGYAALQIAVALRATIVLHRRFDPAATLAAVDRHGCTALFAVPVMLQRLLHDVPAPDRPTGLQVVAVSGSALSGGIATRFMDRYGDVLYNLYGSTEVSWAAIANPADLRRAPNTAGRPPRGTRLAVLGASGEPVPAGQVGQIYVGNELMFEGYTGEGTAADHRHGLLGTGDLGHVDTDGLLFVGGRADDMIVSGGENVFPSDVADLLAQLPQVREAAVTGLPDPQYGHLLAAYLVLHPGETLDPEAVQEYVRRYRARYAVPRYVMFLPALPRNASGKVVTRDLPRPRTPD
ncbi:MULTISPECIES: AMP-binding protein [unclassified Solwaraspora]|uniref:AMP-binding protein n=1 Tax=unclassified Solwaraspora TaxID=2627926 RepID=UPI00259AFFFE|nr:AMP-binding protein [Solwaraspora sp. WMMA2056]WJK43820.1 AMP-binding protein [Solwaraspora sp. WMMA2056]